MKKYIFKTVLCSALAMSLTTSCELDQYPESSIPSEESWQNISDAEKFYNGLLANLRGLSVNSSILVTEVQSDLFNAVVGVSSLNREHEWTFTTNQFGGDANWASNYSLITSANNILDNINSIPTETEDEKALINQIKGASYFARAWAYSNMVPRYCVNYDPATAEKELGLPLVSNVDVNAKPARSNLKATYDFILSDIKKAYDLLGDDTDFTTPNKNVVTALKARVCLNMKLYDEAIANATSLFASYPLTEADAYPQMWAEDNGSEIIYQPLMTQKERAGLYGGLFIGWNESKECWSPSFVPTQGLLDLYTDENDIRKSTFFFQDNISALDQVDEAYFLVKFPGNDALRQEGEDNTNSWMNMIKVFRTSEMYLIAAEASLFKANPDEAAARGYLNTLRAARGASPIHEMTAGPALVKEMKNEWVREMIGEGFRLNCLKRWNDGVERMAPQEFTENILIKTPAEQYIKLNIQPNDPLYYKMVWEIPSNDTQANGNLVPNWKK